LASLVYESQPSAVFLSERRWRGSSRQPVSWQHVQTTSGGRWWGPLTRRAAALEASAAGIELARWGRITECPSPTERQRSASTGVRIEL